MFSRIDHALGFDVMKIMDVAPQYHVFCEKCKKVCCRKCTASDAWRCDSAFGMQGTKSFSLTSILKLHKKCKKCGCENTNHFFITDEDYFRIVGREIEARIEPDNLLMRIVFAPFMAGFIMDGRNLIQEEGTVLDELFKRGQALWEEAWTAEKQGNHDEAERKFNESRLAFEHGLKSKPDSVRFKHWTSLVGLKIDGNQYFNEGTDLQSEANALFNEAESLRSQNKHTEALEKLKLAKDKYEKSLSKFGEGRKRDERFQSCVEFVEEMIETVDEAMKNIVASQEMAIFENVSIQDEQASSHQASSQSETHHNRQNLHLQQ